MTRPTYEELRDFQNSPHCDNPPPVMASGFLWTVLLACVASIFIWASGKDDYPDVCANLTAAECSAAMQECR